MYLSHRIFLFTTAFLIFTLVNAPAKAALVKYSYTGNNFTHLSMSGNSYETPADYPVTNLSFWFIVDDSLITLNGRTQLYHNVSSAGPEYSSIVFSDYHFSNGYGSINYIPSLSRVPVNALFDTDGNGNITGNWSVRISSLTSEFTGEMSSVNYEAPTGPVVTDYTYSPYHADHPLLPVKHNINGELFASTVSVSGNPGTWTRSLITVPLPGGLLLFASILGGYFLKAKKRISAVGTISNSVIVRTDCR